MVIIHHGNRSWGGDIFRSIRTYSGLKQVGVREVLRRIVKEVTYR